jgi:hypothetical protein
MSVDEGVGEGVSEGVSEGVGEGMGEGMGEGVDAGAGEVRVWGWVRYGEAGLIWRVLGFGWLLEKGVIFISLQLIGYSNITTRSWVCVVWYHLIPPWPHSPLSSPVHVHKSTAVRPKRHRLVLQTQHQHVSTMAFTCPCSYIQYTVEQTRADLTPYIFALTHVSNQHGR